MEALKPDDPVWIVNAHLRPRYRLLARLGNGGMGRVYLAKSRTAELVAVKMILVQYLSDVGILQRFREEVANLRLIHGPQVAQYRGANLDTENPWLAVEYVEGCTLRQHIDGSGVLDAQLVAALGVMLAEGIESIHDAGLLHRDLKPHNVMLGNASPRIIDLGLAILRERETYLTQTGVPVGTPAYLSPEQARGDRDLTAAVDVYGLGAMLLCAATGHNPYPPRAQHVVIGMINNPHALPDLSGLPAQLAPLIGSMLAYDASARPAIETVKADLLMIATSDGADFEVVRQELVRQTYVAAPPIPDSPTDLDDPLADLSDPSLSGPEDSEAGDQIPVTGHAPPGADGSNATNGGPKPELGWLMDMMRKQYARRMTL